MERRITSFSRPRLVRADGGQPSKIEGYAAVFYDANDPGSEYQLMSFGSYSVVERLMPGCFDRALREDDVRALFNHDVSLLLGRTSAGTCRLSVDAKGLRYSITPPDATYARDLMSCLQRGDVTGSSFSFDYREKSVTEQRLPDGGERDIIEVRDVKLYDVGPVTFPAYSSTSAEARSTAGRLSPKAMLRYADHIEKEVAMLCGSAGRSGIGTSKLPTDPARRRVVMQARLLEIGA